jgi:Zn-dependent protease with chaperone function
MYAVIFVVGVWFLPSTIFGLLFMVGLTILMVLFQYGISPLIINWLYRIDWIPYEQFIAQFPHLADSLEKVVAYNRIKMPRLGIIHDMNPNAFTFGWSKNSARVVLTDGILKYLNKKEQDAVFSHELGHVVHSDFILMTVVFAIPLLLLTIARWSYYASYFSRGRSSDSDEAGLIRLALIAIAALSYLSYYISYFISLIISRIREYYADEHSAEVLENPNALATGLVKIAYGLLVDGSIEERKKSRVRALRGLGIFDQRAAKGLGVISDGKTGI